MIRLRGGTQYQESATLTLVDDTGHVVEVIAELQDCICRDGHVTLRLVDSLYAPAAHIKITIDKAKAPNERGFLGVRR